MCGKSTCYMPDSEICCRDSRGRVRSYNGRRKVCSTDRTVADLLCPAHHSAPLGAPLSQYSRLCAGAQHGKFINIR